VARRKGLQWLMRENYKATSGKIEVPDNVNPFILLPGEVEPNIPDNAIVLEYLARKTKDVKLAIELLSIMGLSDALLWRSTYGSLSSGQKQRFLLALSLAYRPNLIVIDEFLSYLDYYTAMSVGYKYIEVVNKIGATAIISLNRYDIIPLFLKFEREARNVEFYVIRFGKVYRLVFK